MDVHDYPRKVRIFLANSSYAKYTFNTYVKPVFDAAALDYDVIVQPDIKPHIINLIHTGKEEAHALKSIPPVPTPSLLSRLFYSDPPSLPVFDPIQRYLNLPKYNPDESFVAVGTDAFVEILEAINEACLTTRDQTTLDPVSTDTKEASTNASAITLETKETSTDASAITLETKEKSNDAKETSIETIEISHLDIKLPHLGFIPGRNMLGWKYFPYRVFRWFIERNVATEIGAEAVKIVFAQNTRAIVDRDILLGSGSGLVGTSDKQFNDDEVRAAMFTVVSCQAVKDNLMLYC